MRALPLTLTVLLASTALLSTMPGGAAPNEVREASPIAVLAERYADQFDSMPLPEGLDAVEAAHYRYYEQNVLGRSPADWVAWVNQAFGQPSSSALPAPSQLVNDLIRLYDLVGADFGVSDLVAIEKQAMALPGPVAGPFAALVHVVVDAYAGQASLAASLAQRFPTSGDLDVLVTRGERDAMATRAQGIVAAIAEFQAATQTVWPELSVAFAGQDAPLFVDPEGLVVLGGPGDGTHAPGGAYPDPVLSIDPAGNDLYLHSAGGADPSGFLSHGSNSVLVGGNGIALSVVADFGGDDQYLYDGPVSVVHGSGSIGGMGILVDSEGSDTYSATFTRTTSGPCSICTLSYFDGGAQGHGFGGYGLLLDAAGNDHYQFDFGSTTGRCVWAFGQGFGAAGGLGIASDLGGDDKWHSVGFGITGGDRCWGFGGASAFLGQYVQGVGFYGGVGIINDAGLGNDDYYAYMESKTVDYYSQGFGAFGGLGVQYDDGGDDDYYAVEKALNPWINPTLNCAFGTASAGGVGVFVDVAGNDSYFGDTVSPRGAAPLNEGFGGIGAAYGLFLDLEGDDIHIMEAHGGTFSGVAGRGEALQHGNIIGNYLDAGGQDVYVGPGHDGGIWLGGADLNLLDFP